MANKLQTGRASKSEVSELRFGMDFRKPEYRREVFLRFYELHLKHKAHPGCVYFLLEHIFKKLKLNEEQRLWFCFLNGNTQNPVTTLLIYEKFNDYSDVNKTWPTEFEAWFNWNYKKLFFDLDRRHHKKFLPESIARYKAAVGESQGKFFNSMLTENPGESFTKIYETVTRDFFSFGRLSTWSYLEYLRIAGVNIEPPDLKLRDIDGSRSHRNGLAKVLGRDDLDWHHSNPGFDGQYTEELMLWLEKEAVELLAEARARMAGKPYELDVNNFTLESALCTYKSFFRPNRRYPGVYVDMLLKRINEARAAWPRSEIIEIASEARSLVHPKLLLEKKHYDTGLTPRKQNHFIKTGQLVSMGFEWPCFQNDYDDGDLFK